MTVPSTGAESDLPEPSNSAFQQDLQQHLEYRQNVCGGGMQIDSGQMWYRLADASVLEYITHAASVPEHGVSLHFRGSALSHSPWT